jgi:hypothetical protein
VGRDVGRDEGGDSAVWLDLVARLEMPAPTDPDEAPWPDRENLHGGEASAQPVTRIAEQDPEGARISGSPGSGADQGDPGDSASEQDTSTGGAGSPGGAGGAGSSAGSAGPAGATRLGAGPQDTHPQRSKDTPPRAANSGSDKGTTAKHSRVIRPATFTRYPELANEAALPRQELSPGPEHAADPDADPHSQTRYSADDGYLDAPTSPDLGFLGFLDYDDYDPANPENRYIPPPPPPMPKVDPVVKGAWLALFGGPAYLLIATILGWNVPDWGELLAIAAFVIGFVVLVSKLGDGPSRRDGPDQGAVV